MHWANAAAGLLVFVVMGTPGLLAYFVGLLLYARPRVWFRKGPSIMDYLLRKRDDALTREWKAFLGATHRRAMSLAGRRPHRFLAIAFLLVSLILAVVVGERVSDAPAAIAIASRGGLSLAACATLWLAFFGLTRRTPLVFGTDGVRVRETFVAYSTATTFKRQRDGVVIERSSPLPAVFVGTSDSETTERLISLLTSEQKRARRRRAEPRPPLPTAGFRENASLQGWRVRVLDAATDEERRAVIERGSPDELRELLDETVDPSLEDTLHTQLLRSK